MLPLSAALHIFLKTCSSGLQKKKCLLFTTRSLWRSLITIHSESLTPPCSLLMVRHWYLKSSSIHHASEILFLPLLGYLLLNPYRQELLHFSLTLRGEKYYHSFLLLFLCNCTHLIRYLLATQSVICSVFYKASPGKNNQGNAIFLVPSPFIKNNEKETRVIPAVRHPSTLSYWSFYDNWVSQHIIWAACICLYVYICPFCCCACNIIELIYTGHAVYLTSIATHTENRDLSEILDRMISTVRYSSIPKLHSLKERFDYFTCSIYQIPPDSQYNSSLCGLQQSLLGLLELIAHMWEFMPKGPSLYPLPMDFLSLWIAGESKIACPWIVWDTFPSWSNTHPSMPISTLWKNVLLLLKQAKWPVSATSRTCFRPLGSYFILKL